MGSRLLSFACSSYDSSQFQLSKMEAIKKKMQAREKAEAADNHYDEVAKKLATCESELEKAEERADVGETKILELEEELRVVANNLKSLEVAEEKANQREKTYKEQIKTLTAKLKQAEARAEAAKGGGQAGGRARLRAGEVQGHHRGARADLRRDVRILVFLRHNCHELEFQLELAFETMYQSYESHLFILKNDLSHAST